MEPTTNALADTEPPGLVRWRQTTETPLLILAIGSLPFLLLELRKGELPLHDRRLLDVVNVVVLIAFAVDYVVKLCLTDRRRRYVVREWPSLLIVVAQGVTLLPADRVRAFGVLRVLRAGRAWRAVAIISRLIALGGIAAREGRSILRQRAATFAMGVAAVTWLTSASAVTVLEVDKNEKVTSYFDALWWSSATITTVGYGDVAPVTMPGRLIGMVTMVVGISTFAVLTAKVAEFLVTSAREDAENESG